MIYERQGTFFLCLESTDLLSVKDTKLRMEVSPEAVDQVFLWLRNRFSDSEKTLKTRVRRDRAELSLFAFDARTKWKRSICIYDVHVCEGLESVRGEITEIVKEMVSHTGERDGTEA
jgi:hypothetical protein